jgi:hypothetical protein
LGRGSCRLSATGIRFSGHPFPAEDVGLPHSQPTDHDHRRIGPHRDCHVPHMQDATGLGALSTPGRRCSPGWIALSSAGACRFPAASPARPAPTSHLRASTMTRQHRGFTHVHPPGLSLTRSPRMEQGPFGLNPGLRTPQSPATHARAGTGHRAQTRTTPPSLASHQHSHLPCATSCRTERFTPFLAFPPMLRRVIYTTDEIVKIVVGCRSADHPVTDRPVARSAGFLHRRPSPSERRRGQDAAPHRTNDLDRAEHRHILKAGGTPLHRGLHHQTGARVPVGLVACQCATKTW